MRLHIARARPGLSPANPAMPLPDVMPPIGVGLVRHLSESKRRSVTLSSIPFESPTAQCLVLTKKTTPRSARKNIHKMMARSPNVCENCLYVRWPVCGSSY
jgi:hypothetical protein